MSARLQLRQPSFPRRSSSYLSGSDADDIISPCPPEEQQQQQQPVATTTAAEVDSSSLHNYHFFHLVPAPPPQQQPYDEPQTGYPTMAFMTAAHGSSSSRRGSSAGSSALMQPPSPSCRMSGGDEKHPWEAWHFDPADGEDLDDERLWRRMLAIQRLFHCYKSARMDAALEAGGEDEETAGLVVRK